MHTISLDSLLVGHCRKARLAVAFLFVVLPGLSAQVIYVPLDNGGGISMDAYAEANVGYSFGVNYGEGMVYEHSYETAQWDNNSPPPGNAVFAQVASTFPQVTFDVRGQGGFNAAGLSQLKLYAHMSGETEAELNFATFSASSYTTAYHEFALNAPDGFWEMPDTSYILRHTFAVDGVISKTGNANVSLSFGAFPGMDSEFGDFWYFDYFADDYFEGFTNLEFSEVFMAEWPINPEHDTHVIQHSASVEMDVQGGGAYVFDLTADFFNTAAPSTITLLTQTGEDDPVVVVAFDSMGNVIAGNPGFSLSTPVPEPRTFVFVLGLAALLAGVLGRRSRAR